MDDSFITLSYAKNLVEYGHVGWNKGKLFVEGYSNFSYVMLAALAIKLGLSAIIVLKIVSIFMFTVSLCFLYHLSRLWMTPQLAFIPSILLLCYKGQILWTVSGLETSTFQCFLLLSAHYLIRGLGYQDVSQNLQPQRAYALNFNAFFLCGLFLGLSGLTRPEAPALMIIPLITMSCFYPEYRSEKKRFFQASCIIIVVFTLIYAPYFFWRWHYYGRLFPNAVYCKWLVRISQGILDWNYLRLIWPLLILSLPYLLWEKDKRTILLISPSILYLIMLYDSDTISGFYNRLFLPAFCLLLPLPVFGLVKLSQFYFRKKHHMIKMVYLCSIFVGIALIPNFSLWQYYSYALSSRKGIEYRFELIGWSKANLNTNDTIVLADCGLIPYALDMNFIDSYCLNNPLITQKPINHSYSKFVDWVLKEENPEAIILSSWENNVKGYIEPAAQHFLNNKLFFRQYHLVHIITTLIDNQSFSYDIYKRRA